MIDSFENFEINNLNYWFIIEIFSSLFLEVYYLLYDNRVERRINEV